MKPSRLFFASVACAAIAVGTFVASAQSQPATTGPVNVATNKFPITVTAGDYDLVNQVLDFPPGSSVPNHVHGGPVVLSVLSGELTVVDATGDHLVKAGQSATEKSGYVHAAYNRGTAPARVSLSYLVPKGAALTTMSK